MNTTLQIKSKATRMKAIVCTRYGSPDLLEFQEVPVPSFEENEVLVKVYASNATTADSMMRRADPFVSRFFLGFTKPKNAIIGTGFAGKIEAVGKAVTNFKVGDAVFGESGIGFGANAEYVAVAADGVITIKPEYIKYEEAALFCDGPLTSLNFLQELAHIQPGQRVLIHGASGSLGTAAVQLAKHFGAEVTGVCSGSNVEWVEALGADHVIDYTQQDFTQTGNTYDIIFDTIGKSSFSHSKNSLTQNGVYLSPVLKFGLLLQMLWTSVIGNKKAKFSATGLQPAPELRNLLEQLIELFEAKKLTLIIDRRFSLAETAEAHRHVDTGHKKGNVVLTVIETLP